MVEGLFREYHTSSAALGLQCPEVTKQPLINDSQTAVVLIIDSLKTEVSQIQVLICCTLFTTHVICCDSHIILCRLVTIIATRLAAVTQVGIHVHDGSEKSVNNKIL